MSFHQQPKKYRMEIRVTMREEPYNQCASGLEVHEDLIVTADSFLQMAEVLGRFHQLADEVRKRG